MSAALVKRDIKHKFVLERLRAAGVTHSQQGISVYELDYKELRHELVLQTFREIDTENENNVWF